VLRLLLLTLSLTLVARGGFEARRGEVRVVGLEGVDESVVAAVVLEVERVERRFTALGFPLREAHLPMTVLLFEEADALGPYLDEASRERSRGLSFRGADRRYVLLAWRAPGDPFIALAHELAHLADPDPERPLWFREGIAEHLAHLRPNSRGGVSPLGSPGHLFRLRTGGWIPLEDFMAPSGRPPAGARSSFYAQAWLTVRLLANAEPEPRRLRPEMLRQAIDTRGVEAVEAELRAFADALEAPAEEFEAPHPSDTPDALRSLENWEEPYWRAEALRETQHVDEARSALAELRRDHPNVPRIAAALGALEMDAGRYVRAEALLAEAAADEQAEVRVLYRYSLMLLRPGPGDAADQAQRALAQMEKARRAYPSQPSYLLTQAQAAMVAERWDSAARLLSDLLASPGWNERAEREFEELLRRRRQTLTSVPRPKLRPSGPVEMPGFFAHRPESPQPPKPVEIRWPPPGSSIVYGRLATVECKGGEQLLVLQNPLFKLKYRIRRGRSVKLFHPPIKWKKIPCGTRGFEVNIAFRPSSEKGPVQGDVIAVLF